MRQTIRILLAVAAATVLMNGCTLQPAAVKDERLNVAAGQPTGYLLGSVGAVAKGEGRSGAATNALGLRNLDTGADFELAYTINSMFALSPTDIKEDNKKLAVYRLALPPGNYEIYRMRFFENGGYITATYQNKKNFSLPFTVEAGEEVYLGEALAARIPGKSFLSATAGYRFDFSDQRLRDFPVIEARFPDFAPSEARTYLPARAIILEPPDVVIVEADASRPAVSSP